MTHSVSWICFSYDSLQLLQTNLCVSCIYCYATSHPRTQWLNNNHLCSSCFCGSAAWARLAQAVLLAAAWLAPESIGSAVRQRGDPYLWVEWLSAVVMGTLCLPFSWSSRLAWFTCGDCRVPKGSERRQTPRHKHFSRFCLCCCRFIVPNKSHGQAQGQCRRVSTKDVVIGVDKFWAGLQ